MKHPKILPSLISMAVLAAIATPAQSHVFYKKIDITKAGKQYKGEYAYPNSGGTNSLTHIANGWVVASKPRTLAQTMSSNAVGDANWLRFHLDTPALVNIDEIPRAAPGGSAALTPKDRSTWDAANADPAFSLYRGLVPMLAMTGSPDNLNDYDVAQPLAEPPPVPEDGSVMSWMYSAMSKWDAAPNDPNISITIFDLDQNGLAKPSPLGFPKRINNPDWTLTISQLVADMTADPGNVAHPWRASYLSDHLQNLLASDASTTVSEWYTNNYQAHNGYRDTLNFTTFEGGMCLEDTPGADDLSYGNGNFGMPGGGCYIGMAANYSSFGYLGEVDTLGDFSLPNGYANAAMDADYMASHPNYDPATTTMCPETNPDGSPGECAGGNPAGVDWAKISYLGHANRHDSEGQVETPDGRNMGSSNISAEHLHGIYLTAGDYTLYVSGGCGECYDHTGGGSSIPPEYGGAMGSPSPYDTHIGGMNLSLNAWPVKECAAQQSGQQRPELSPLSGPWDVTAGTSTSVDLHAYYCGNDVPQFQTKPGFTAETASPEAKTPNGWKSTLNWTAPTVSKAKLVTTTVTAAGSNGKSKSNAQKVTMRVWPEGLSPTNSFEVKNIKASWDAKKFKFKVTGKVVLKNANVLKPEEKQALFGNYLILNNGAGMHLLDYGIPDIMPSAKGVISHEQPADISAIPCTLKWHYRSQQGSVPVKNAPKDCIPDVPI